MITNKNLYEMLSTQITDSNEALREQLKSQVLESANKSEKSVVEELSEKYTSEINNLKTEFNNQLEKLNDNLKEETFEKLDTQMTQILKVNQNLAEKIVNLQKDTAIIMETLQLILTNMMLNKVPDKIDSSER